MRLNVNALLKSCSGVEPSGICFIFAHAQGRPILIVDPVPRRVESLVASSSPVRVINPLCFVATSRMLFFPTALHFPSWLLPRLSKPTGSRSNSRAFLTRLRMKRLCSGCFASMTSEGNRWGWCVCEVLIRVCTTWSPKQPIAH